MAKHQLQDDKRCEKVQTEYGTAYDPDCPDCAAEEKEESLLDQPSRPGVGPGRKN